MPAAATAASAPPKKNARQAQSSSVDAKHGACDDRTDSKMGATGRSRGALNGCFVIIYALINWSIHLNFTCLRSDVALLQMAASAHQDLMLTAVGITILVLKLPIALIGALEEAWRSARVRFDGEDRSSMSLVRGCASDLKDAGRIFRTRFATPVSPLRISAEDARESAKIRAGTLRSLNGFLWDTWAECFCLDNPMQFCWTAYSLAQPTVTRQIYVQIVAMLEQYKYCMAAQLPVQASARQVMQEWAGWCSKHVCRMMWTRSSRKSGDDAHPCSDVASSPRGKVPASGSHAYSDDGNFQTHYASSNVDDGCSEDAGEQELIAESPRVKASLDGIRDPSPASRVLTALSSPRSSLTSIMRGSTNDQDDLNVIGGIEDWVNTLASEQNPHGRKVYVLVPPAWMVTVILLIIHWIPVVPSVAATVAQHLIPYAVAAMLIRGILSFLVRVGWARRV